MNRQRIGVDLDDTTFDFVRPLLSLYNETYNDNLSIDCITDYRIHQFLNPECKSLFQEFATDEFISALEPLEGCTETLTYLNEHHDIFFVTAGHPVSCKARDMWLSRTFEWYSTSQFIRCQNKHLLNLDILIDDNVDNLSGFDGWKFLFDRPWNNVELETPMCRVYSWEEIYKLLVWN